METTTVIFSIFGVVGVLAIFSALTYFFTAVGKNVTRLQIHHVPPSVKSTQFLRNLVAITGGSLTTIQAEECELISNNDLFRIQLLKEIDAAVETIAITTYVWREDQRTNEVFQHLKAAVARGVTVRVLIDMHGSKLSHSFLSAAEASGIRVGRFRPFTVGKLSTYHARTHRRAYIFDGKVAYVGGSAFSERWLQSECVDTFTYTDIMYRLTGASVPLVAGSMGELWCSACGEALQIFTHDSVPQTSAKHNAVYLSHSPRLDIHPLTYFYWYSFISAKHSITLVSPYFVPGRAIREVLLEKARSGVSVEVITQGTSEMWFVTNAGRSYYRDLLDAGVRIVEYQKPHLHTKLAVIDDQLSVMGSANVDIRSQRINHENVFAVHSEVLASEHQELIAQYRTESVEVDSEKWSERSIFTRVLQRFLRQFSEQF